MVSSHVHDVEIRIALLHFPVTEEDSLGISLVVRV